VADPIIETHGLMRTFGTGKRAIHAVRGVDLAVGRGEVFGFLGPNGAGKSTTINMLCTLLTPTGGEARVAGYDVVEDPHQVRQAIGLVFQDPSLDERLSARENMAFHAMLYGIPRRERGRRIGDLLEVVGLADRGDDLVRTYSGGMKRRLEIARGLLHRPAVLFLDEPTLGLDPQTRRRMWDYIHALRERVGITLFLTTHYMDEAEHCGRIAIIDEGKIVALDTPDRLKARVGHDRVEIGTPDPAGAARHITERYGIPVTEGADEVSFQVDDGARFLPGLLAENRLDAVSVAVHRPTLEDVFLELTGRAIRDEAPDPFATVKASARRGGR